MTKRPPAGGAFFRPPFEPVLVAALPVELQNKNDGQGHSWHRTAEARQKLERALASQPELQRQPFDFPAAIRFTRLLGRGQRLWDADSVLRGNAKQILDALTKLGWFYDDGPPWIVDAHGIQDASERKNGPGTLIEVFEAGEKVSKS